MPADRYHSDQNESAMLFGRSDTGAERVVLRSSQRDVDRHLLPGGDHDLGPLEVPPKDSSHH
jgi:hypothetical protein